MFLANSVKANNYWPSLSSLKTPRYNYLPTHDQECDSCIQHPKIYRSII